MEAKYEGNVEATGEDVGYEANVKTTGKDYSAKSTHITGRS